MPDIEPEQEVNRGCRTEVLTVAFPVSAQMSDNEPSEGRINLIFILSLNVIRPLLPSSSAFITVKGLMNIYSADWAPEGGSLQHETGHEVRVIALLHPRVQMKPPSSVKLVHFNPVSCL